MRELIKGQLLLKFEKEYVPFTYLIGWSKLGVWYYVVHYAKKNKTAHPENLWKNYFTSSKYVKNMRLDFGEPDIIEVRRVFSSAEKALAWEVKVLRRLQVVDSDQWLNKNVGG